MTDARHKDRSSGLMLAAGSALAVAALLLFGAGNIQAATLSGSGIDATVTATLTPSSLPKRGSAPVGLSVSETISNGTFPIIARDAQVCRKP